MSRALRSLIRVLRQMDDWTTGLLVLEYDRAARNIPLISTEADRKRILFEERGRLTRDVHDGIGAQLLSLIVRTRTRSIGHAEMERQLQGSLEDLRLIVDSMDASDDNFTAAMQSFRARLIPQVQAAGIELNWCVAEEDLASTHFCASRILNIYRFLQEATANVIRHAEADGMMIEARCIDRTNLMVAVEDNGIGLSSDALVGNGKGLGNMNKRARALGGHCRHKPGPSQRGTRVEMEIPLR